VPFTKYFCSYTIFHSICLKIVEILDIIIVKFLLCFVDYFFKEISNVSVVIIIFIDSYRYKLSAHSKNRVLM